jgi:hypothetical protein
VRCEDAVQPPASTGRNPASVNTRAISSRWSP